MSARSGGESPRETARSISQPTSESFRPTYRESSVARRGSAPLNHQIPKERGFIMATTQTNQKPSAPTSRLGSVKGGVIHAPKRYFFYGADGTGKTTLAADAPGAIFADIEGGSEEHDIKRYMFWDDDEEGFKPRAYEDVLFMIHELTTADHSYKTLVLDTVDCLEPLLWAWMIKRDNDPSVMTRKNPLNQVEDYGYGFGYDRAVDV